MRRSLFITGAAGYVGRRLLELAPADRRIVALVRDRRVLPAELRDREHIEVVEGDLLEPDSYALALGTCEYVLHLAAVTGNAPRARYFEVNEGGTRTLLEAARRGGVRGVAFVSSIAAGFADQRRYWYAQSKARAEDLVRRSGIAHSVVRPAIVVGPGAPVVEGLCRLASAPVMPVFGRGDVRVQPVFADDLVRCLLDLVDEQRFLGETLEVGGGDVVSVEELLRRLRRACGRGAGPLLHLPLSPLRSLVGALEALRVPLPLSAGQLATFANDGTAAPHAWLEERRPRMRGLDEALAGAGPAFAASRRDAAFERAARKLGRYLAGRDPGAYVVAKYVEFHRSFAERLGRPTRFDRLLLALAARAPAGWHLVDVYTGRFGRTSVPRAELALMLALLECSPSTAETLDRTEARGRARSVIGLVARAGVESLCLLLAAVLLLPVHGASVLLGDRPVEAAS